MSYEKQYLLRQHFTYFQMVLDIVGRQYECLSPDHFIYIPDKFFLGRFKVDKEGFRWSEKGILYKNSVEDLAQVERWLDSEALEIVRPISLPEDSIDSLMKNVRTHSYSKQDIKNNFANFKDYLL